MAAVRRCQQRPVVQLLTSALATAVMARRGECEKGRKLHNSESPGAAVLMLVHVIQCASAHHVLDILKSESSACINCYAPLALAGY